MSKTLLECCATQAGNFCPMCGRQLKDPDPLTSLLRHCYRTARTFEVTRQRCERDYPKMAEHDAKCAAKWMTWAKALEAVIPAPKVKP